MIFRTTECRVTSEKAKALQDTPWLFLSFFRKEGQKVPDILSVGIDIGTSTTQLVFSRITMENTTGYFSVPRVSIVDKEVIYKSPVHITPLTTPVLIDGEAIRDLVAREFSQAGFTPADVDTGAVIITGESARKENAAAVLEKLSGFAGEFVVSTAGPDLESIIAGKGSGAFQYSLDEHCSAVNLDIGGGTTNIVLFQDGEAAGKGCLDIGGRLIRLTPDLTVERVSPAAALVAQAVGVTLTPGSRTTLEDLTKITDKMADLLAQALFLKPQEPLLRAIQTPESSWLDLPGVRIDRICFSGGVADCMTSDSADPVPYGDIGILLGRSIARGELVRSIPAIQGVETIRATVVGAGTYTTSISGSTITYANELFPMKSVPALKLTRAEQEDCFAGRSDFLADKIRWFLDQSSAEVLILALPGKPDPSYEELKVLAASLAQGMDAGLPPDAPVLVVLEQDIAKALGILLESQLRGRRKVACIDGIKVDQGDYIDLGRPVMDGLVIPVVVKTLLFG